MYTHIYIYIYMYIYMFIYMYIYNIYVRMYVLKFALSCRDIYVYYIVLCKQIHTPLLHTYTIKLY